MISSSTLTCASSRWLKTTFPTQNKVSRIWGDTKGQATDRDCALVLARTDGDPDLSRNEIDWDEQYKDGGPDAAHERLKKLKVVS